MTYWKGLTVASPADTSLFSLGLAIDYQFMYVCDPVSQNGLVLKRQTEMVNGTSIS